MCELKSKTFPISLKKKPKLLNLTTDFSVQRQPNRKQKKEESRKPAAALDVVLYHQIEQELGKDQFTCLFITGNYVNFI